MSESLVETIQLDVDESNELLFKVNIEGHATGPAKVRLVCEGEGDTGFIFHGRPAEEGLVQFVLKKGLKEGTYPAKIEVLVENKYFVPVNFNIEMKKSVSVVVEAIQAAKVIKRDELKVTASPIVVKPRPEAKHVVIEGPQKPVTNVTTPKKDVSTSTGTKASRASSRSGTLAERYNQRKKS